MFYFNQICLVCELSLSQFCSWNSLINITWWFYNHIPLFLYREILNESYFWSFPPQKMATWMLVTVWMSTQTFVVISVDTPCPTAQDWILEGDYCYYFSAGANTRLSWTDANTWCMDNGGYLVSIHGKDEQDMLIYYVRLVSQHINHRLQR